MTNNDIFRRVRYIFDFDDSEVINIFSLADAKVTREEISDWLKKDDDPDIKGLPDRQFATFLNGLINLKRGKKDSEQLAPEKELSNNIIFRKLKIALDLKAEEVLAILTLAGVQISPHELSAFFRRKDHKHYRECKDQVLRNFLQGLQLKHRESKIFDGSYMSR